MKNRGFTLVELIAMLVVLGILMTIAIPNITGMIANQRYSIIKNDGIRLADKVRTIYSVRKNMKYPNTGECSVFSLNYLDDNEDFKEGPNGKEYDRYESFILVTKEGKKYIFYVRLVEKTNVEDEFFGLNMKTRTLISKEEVGGIINTKISKIGLNNNKSNNINRLKNSDIDIIKNKCNGGEGIKSERYYN